MKCPEDICLIIKVCPKNERLRLYLKETETQGIVQGTYTFCVVMDCSKKSEEMKLENK